MSAAALVLVLLSGVIHVIWNVALKKTPDATATFAGGIVIALAVYSPFYWTFIHGSYPTPPLSVLPGVIFTGLTEGCYLILLTYTYNRADLSLVYPVSRGSSPLFIALGGAALLAERPGVLGLLGIAVVVGGVAAVAWPGAGTRVTPRTVALSLLTGAAIAAHHVGYKWLFQYYPPSAALYVVWGVTAATIVGYAFFTRGGVAVFSHAKRHLPAVALVGTCSLGGFLLALLALQTTYVSYLGAARNIGIVCGVFFGNRLLKEGGLGRRLAGAVAITCGILLIALA